MVFSNENDSKLVPKGHLNSSSFIIQYSLFIKGVLQSILQHALCALLLLFHGSVKEGDHLGPVADAAHAEGAAAHAVGAIVFHGPQDGGTVPCGVIYIGEDVLGG